MLLTTGILAGLVAVGAASPAPTGVDNRGRWSISCDSDNKCDYVQNAAEMTHSVSPVVARGGNNSVNFTGVCHECEFGGSYDPTCAPCQGKGNGEHPPAGYYMLGCFPWYDPEPSCVTVKDETHDPRIHGDISSKTQNVTGIVVSVLRRRGPPQSDPEPPYSKPSDEPGYEGVSKGPAPPPTGPSSVIHGPGPLKPTSTKPYATPSATTSSYDPPKPSYTGGKPSGGPPHGFGKPTGSPSSPGAVYSTPSKVSEKPTHGPESPAHGPPTYVPDWFSHGPPPSGHGKPTPVLETTSVTYDKPSATYGKPSGSPKAPVHGPPKDKETYHGPVTSSYGSSVATPVYGPPKFTSGEPSHGPGNHGFKSSTPAYGPATSATSKSVYGPGKPTSAAYKPTGGQKKPAKEEYPAKPEDESSTPAKPIGKPTGGKPSGGKPAAAKPTFTKPVLNKPSSAKTTGAKPTGAKPAAGKPKPAIPEHAKPAVPGGVSKKPMPYIEFDEAECIDCHEGDSCYDECDWMFLCGQKKKCFHNGARDIVEICYEKGQKCPDDEEFAEYAKPKSADKPTKASKTLGKPTPTSTPEAE